MKMDHFETRQRPEGKPQRNLNTLTAALRNTLDSGDAVFLAANGHSMAEMQASVGGLRTYLKAEGLRIVTRQGDGGLYLWTVRREE